MKRLIVLLISLALSIVALPAQADDQRVLAIIDTAIDSSKFPGIVYEACFTLKSCPNGKPFMEGPGSANVKDAGWKLDGFMHGTEVTSSAFVANPSLKVVFIRIADLNEYPTFSAMHSDGSSLDKAFDWVSKNYAKYSIDAVSVSQTRLNFTTCPVNKTIEGSVQVLKSAKVPVFAGTGNSALVNKVGFPACVLDVNAVGAATESGQPYYYSHLGAGVDLMSIGRFNITYNGTTYPVSGTSIATPYAAAKWVGTPYTLDSLPKIQDKFKTSYPFVK